MNLLLTAFKIILLGSGIVLVLTGLIMILFVKSFLEFEKNIDKKYFTFPGTSPVKQYSFANNFFSSHARLSGVGLLILGIYFLFYFVKIAAV